MHNALGLRDLDRLYLEAGALRFEQQSLSARVLQALDIELFWDPSDLERFPKTGPVIAVANHPCGLIDGLLLDVFLSKIRPEAKIIANRLLCGIPEAGDRFVPVEVLRARAEHGNSHSLRRAVRLLREGALSRYFRPVRWHTGKRPNCGLRNRSGTKTRAGWPP